MNSIRTTLLLFVLLTVSAIAQAEAPSQLKFGDVVKLVDGRIGTVRPSNNGNKEVDVSFGDYHTGAYGSDGQLNRVNFHESTPFQQVSTEFSYQLRVNQVVLDTSFAEQVTIVRPLSDGMVLVVNSKGVQRPQIATKLMPALEGGLLGFKSNDDVIVHIRPLDKYLNAVVSKVWANGFATIRVNIKDLLPEDAGTHVVELVTPFKFLHPALDCVEVLGGSGELKPVAKPIEAPANREVRYAR